MPQIILSKKVAQYEARMHTRNGYPNKIVPVYRHGEFCLVSDGLIVPKQECTCGARTLIGYSLQIVGKYDAER